MLVAANTFTPPPYSPVNKQSYNCTPNTAR